MSSRSILAVAGLDQTTEVFRRRLLELANRHGWDVDAIATVISVESGFRAAIKNPDPRATAVGLLQFTAATLRRLGFLGTRDDFSRLSAEAQLPFVERYFVEAERGGKLLRPVDYYLVVWGVRAGLPDSEVLAARDGPNPQTFDMNKSLDVNNDGVIHVSDLRRRIETQMARAKGRLEIPAAPGNFGSRVLFPVAVLYAGYELVKAIRRRRSA
jgi:hypothetical protein